MTNGQKQAGWLQALRSRLSQASAGRWADVLFVPVAIIVLVVYFASVNEYFLTSLNVENIFYQATVLAIVAFGVTFVILAGELDLSVGSGVALSGVVAAFVMVDTGSILLGVLTAVGVGIAIGIVNGLVVTKLEVPSFIATFGMLVIAHGIALAVTDGGAVAGLPDGLESIAREGPIGISWIIWVALAVFGVLYFVQSQTSFGIKVFGAGGNRHAAHLVGVNVNRVRFLVFLISGITIGIAGFVLTARLESGQPNGGLLLELDAIAAIVIGGTSIFGGRGSVVRTAFGVLLISVLANGLELQGVGDDLKQVIIGSVLIVAASADFVRVRLRGRRPQLAGSRTAAGAPSTQ